MRTATIDKNHKHPTSYGCNCPPRAIAAHCGGQLPLFAERDRGYCGTAPQHLMPDTQRFEEARHHVVGGDRRNELRHPLSVEMSGYRLEQCVGHLHVTCD